MLQIQETVQTARLISANLINLIRAVLPIMKVAFWMWSEFQLKDKSLNVIYEPMLIECRFYSNPEYDFKQNEKKEFKDRF